MQTSILADRTWISPLIQLVVSIRIMIRIAGLIEPAALKWPPIEVAGFQLARCASQFVYTASVSSAAGRNVDKDGDTSADVIHVCFETY